jgi:hypothetical protein
VTLPGARVSMQGVQHLVNMECSEAPVVTSTWAVTASQPGSATAVLHSWLLSLLHSYNWCMHQHAVNCSVISATKTRWPRAQNSIPQSYGAVPSPLTVNPVNPVGHPADDHLTSALRLATQSQFAGMHTEYNPSVRTHSPLLPPLHLPFHRDNIPPMPATSSDLTSVLHHPSTAMHSLHVTSALKPQYHSEPVNMLYARPSVNQATWMAPVVARPSAAPPLHTRRLCLAFDVSHHLHIAPAITEALMCSIQRLLLPFSVSRTGACLQLVGLHEEVSAWLKSSHTCDLAGHGCPQLLEGLSGKPAVLQSLKSWIEQYSEVQEMLRLEAALLPRRLSAAYTPLLAAGLAALAADPRLQDVPSKCLACHLLTLVLSEPELPEAAETQPPSPAKPQRMVRGEMASGDIGISGHGQGFLHRKRVFMTSERTLGLHSLDTLDSGGSNCAHSSHLDLPGQRTWLASAVNNPKGSPLSGQHGHMESLSWNLPSVPELGEEWPSAAAPPGMSDESGGIFRVPPYMGAPSSASTNATGSAASVSEAFSNISAGSGSTEAQLGTCSSAAQPAGANTLSAYEASVMRAIAMGPDFSSNPNQSSQSMSEALLHLKRAANCASSLQSQWHPLFGDRNGASTSSDTELSRGSKQLSHNSHSLPEDVDGAEGLASLLKQMPQFMVSDSPHPQKSTKWLTRNSSAPTATATHTVCNQAFPGALQAKEHAVTAAAAAQACSIQARRPNEGSHSLTELRAAVGLTCAQPDICAGPSVWQMYMMFVSVLHMLPRYTNAPPPPPSLESPLVAFGEQHLPTLCANPRFAPFRPSLLAAACMVCARRTYSFAPEWPQSLAGVTGLLLLQQTPDGGEVVPTKTGLFLLSEQVAEALQVPLFTPSAYQQVLVHGLDGMLRPDRRPNRLTSKVPVAYAPFSPFQPRSLLSAAYQPQQCIRCSVTCLHALYAL